MANSDRSGHLSLVRVPAGPTISMPEYVEPDPAELERIRQQDDELLGGLMLHTQAVVQRLSVDNAFRNYLVTELRLMAANGIKPPQPRLVEAAS
jgi:hypothetical protein